MMEKSFDLQNLLKDLASRNDSQSSSIIKAVNESLLSETEDNKDVSIFLNHQATEFEQMLASLQSSYSENGREKIKGYKENFFNEIIQNIEDLSPINDSMRPECDTVNITIYDHSDSYEIVCSYVDPGFLCSDIYGLCNEGRGAKDSSHVGKYGIGIKAVFSVASLIIVESNIRIIAENGNVQICKNRDWDRIHTCTTYVIPKKDDCWLNISKISFVVNDDIKAFISDDPKCVLFDYRALIFTKKIKCIRINDWVIKSELIKKDKNSCYAICKLSIDNLNQEVFSSSFLSYTPKTDNMIIDVAFPVSYDKDIKLYNRIYSVYFVKNYEMDSLNETGILVNLNKKYTNSSRSEVADTLAGINEVHSNILDKLNQVFLNFTDKNIAQESTEVREAISIVFHDHLLSYCDRIIEYEKKSEHIDLGLFVKVLEANRGNEYLQKLKNEQREYNYKYVVKEKQNEEYMIFDNICEKMEDADKKTEVYHRIIEAKEVITYENIIYDSLSDAIKSLYEIVNNNKENQTLRRILNYYDSVRSFIRFRVFGYNQNLQNWQTFLSYENIDKNILRNDIDKKYLRKILGSYGILEFLDRTGQLKRRKLTVLDYLFLDDNINTELEKEIVGIYEEKYGLLKASISKGITNLTVIEPVGTSRRGWNGTCDFNCTYHEKPVIDKKLIFQLLDLINDYNLYDNIRFNGYLCNSKNVPLSLKQRDKDFENSRDILKCKMLCFEGGLNQECSIDEQIHYQPILDKISNNTTRNYYFTVSEKDVFIPDMINLVSDIARRMKDNLPNYPVKILHINTENFSNQCDEDYSSFVREVSCESVKDVVLSKIPDVGRGNAIVFIDRKGIHVKASSLEGYKRWNYGDNDISDEDRVFVFYSGRQTKEDALADSIREMGLGKDVEEQIEGYVSMTSIGSSVSSYEYERALKSNIDLGKGFDENDGKSELPKSIDYLQRMTVKDKKKLLLARGSYDGCCPICREPLMGEAKVGLSETVKYAKLFTVKIFKEYGNGQFFQSCCCYDCLELLRKTATDIKLVDNRVILNMKFVSGEKGAVVKEKTINLSHVNKLIGFLNPTK